MIYRPLGKSSALSQSEQIRLVEHEQAMQLYLQGLWQQAKPLFEELNQRYPSQHYQLILGRMQANDYHAPKDWEGIINLVDL
jgi:hypothetical protein